jgi:1-phosphofructokinase
MADPSRRCALAVFAPSPLLTVTVEPGPEGEPELHLHAGGQGFWVARMGATLGADVVLCCPLGGETGAVLKERMEHEGVTVRSVRCEGANAAYVHDRRDGQRVALAETRSPTLSRHELDELYGMALTTGLDADITLLTGPHHETVLPGDTYRRLASDLRANGRPVIADLSGGALDGALEGGIDLLKLSDEEVVAAGYANAQERDELVGALERLMELGADSVLISRERAPALASVDGRLVEIVGPRFTALDPRGTGDSMFAAIGFALACGSSMADALRLAVAAGSLNATRRGLGSGHRTEIQRILRHVEVRNLESQAGDDGSSRQSARSARMP